MTKVWIAKYHHFGDDSIISINATKLGAIAAAERFIDGGHLRGYVSRSDSDCWLHVNYGVACCVEIEEVTVGD